MLAVLLLQLATATGMPPDPFAFFGPTITISQDDRRQLDSGEPVTRVLPGRDLEVVVFATVPVDVDGDRLVAWMRRIKALKRSEYVLGIGRFSDPPTIGDLDRLSLDDGELSDIRTCRPGDCALKLSTGEMRTLQAAAAQAGDNWKAALQAAFRHAVLDRVRAYLADGTIAMYDDRDPPVSPAIRFNALLDRSAFLRANAADFVEHLRGYPATASPSVESFIYWSKEHLGGKPIVSVTHVSILRGTAEGTPDALVAGQEIFATHYVNASLGVTAIVAGGPGGPNYLAYINRSEVDMLRGVFGGLIRYFMQRRLKAEAAGVLAGLRQRLERGGPPDS